ncbi:MAG: aldo/keto reductase [Microcystis panniformis Mp_MB_F_20051200_S9]|uniref:Aldo/keto reductase n=1 Tax=Microcystis panniformis Mp_MB_F_20051200_S9 TaxID=2486223 RepID=A0A552PXQ0_9CHRO|nr:MAG: aldo/keto reductase [Microcystis panniformis Mp_GB_SS_20050300_S99D]TRV49467.1 MAG: aldo/keto reductase [Microcystis panniformis Mp_MB_F_20080800_S26D]TRV50954.1 MAG: aldo/keto reductase [Microcystis panniformis Mp_GB_SS_20050300_S99]TRV61719.1 MAG: aldo/keto reductase [Microcystis panniformis Mp_MB_F_20051200_S9]TRV63118.1 MAG: aldo/keto reductase [Microcystis panniformis Mp_MB_F_20080800_S26]TRV67711.1 MAG: aldo/keto reductase [Microcystis panniformis Mp_MB_F_20051200_S9D]TRV72678.1
MQKCYLGQTNIEITPLLVGTWQAGKKMWAGIEDEESIRAIRAAFEAGITTVDTAEIYGEGHSESIVAQALADVRERVIYATKVFANHLKYEQVIAACDRSLKNLQTDYIDLYQIHWPSGSWNTEIVPISETMAALNYLKAQGKIRALGVSNFSRSQLEEASQYGRIESIQPPYSLFWRSVEKKIMPYCIENNISILAYSPLAQGLLTGKFRNGYQLAAEDHRIKNKLFHGENFPRVQAALNQLEPIANRYHCSLAQLSLAWLIKQPQTNAIAGVRNATQAVNNAQAMTISLTPEDLKLIDNIGKQVTDFLDDNPVLWDF